MKKVVSLCLVLVLLCSLLVFSVQTVSAENQGVTILIDGETKNLIAYNIKDNNYFKLRDIANALKGTKAEFDVIWNEEKQAIELLSRTPYSTDEAITSELLINPVATSSYVPIYKDGAVVLLGAYNIADNNYFKLRDVAAAMNFGVTWNAEQETIEIDTTKGYTYPESSDFGLNTQYLSYLGKTKTEVDSIFGKHGYSAEHGLSSFGDIMFGWNSLGEEPTASSPAVSLYIPLENLFYNCPETLSLDRIKSLFTSSMESYNEMDEERVFLVNYCGKVLAFYPDYGLGKKNVAFINVMTDYENPAKETIQVINNRPQKPAEPEKSIAYYEFALEHDAEFWEINQHWRDDRNYYYLMDVDHDGRDELVVKIGAGLAVYKEINGTVETVLYDPMQYSGGGEHRWPARYEDKDYIIYTTASSTEQKILYVVEENVLNIVFDSSALERAYKINDKFVTYEEYTAYVDSIEYPLGIGIEELK